MKRSLPLILVAFGFVCAVLSVGQAEGRIGKESEAKIESEYSGNPFSFTVRPVSNPFYNPLRTKGRKLTAGNSTPAANTTEDEGPPTCTTTADCDHLYSYPGLPNGTSFDCYDGMIYGYPNGNVCGVVCDTDTYCEEFGKPVNWPPGSTCHKKDPSSTSGVCKFAGTPDIGGENICKDPARFDASEPISSDGMTCGSIKMICNNLRDVGGLMETYMSALVDQWVPACCGVEVGTGRDHYNQESGCGSLPGDQSESTEQMMCGLDPDNKFMPERVVDGECRSEFNDEAERCHEERCRKEKAFCESKRGQLIDPDKDAHRRYPNDLVHVPRLCSETLGACSYYRGGGGGAYCQYTKNDGEVDRCIDRECNKDKATCLSREGTTTPTDPSQIHRNMEWVESGDRSLEALVSELRYVTDASATCCSKGRDPSQEYFSPSCHAPAVKEKALANLGCEPGKFNFGREVQMGGHRQRCMDVVHNCAHAAKLRGTCETPDHGPVCHEVECRASKEGCHAKRGKDGFGDNLEFKPFTFLEAAMNLVNYRDSISPCCDGEILMEKCKAHPDVPVVDTGMCKSGTFQPSKELPTGDCYSRVWDDRFEHGCHDEQCRTDPAYCESRSGQHAGDEQSKIYGPNMTFHRHTCAFFLSRQNHITLMRGECGEWDGEHFHDKCHDTRCKNKAGCEAEGFTFKPWDQSDIEEANRRTAKHVFINSDSVENYGICCGGAENLRTSDYPYTLEPLNIPEGYITDGGEKGCEKCDCCGNGTTCKDGHCYPTLLGAIEACKVARGEKWAWTCDGETQCASNANIRRLQRTPNRGMRWSQGWHTSKPATHGSVPRNARRRATHRSPQHRPAPWNQRRRATHRAAAPQHRPFSWNQHHRVGNQAPRGRATGSHRGRKLF